MMTKVSLRVFSVYLLLSAPLRGALAADAIPDCSLSPVCKSLFEQGKEQSSAGNLAEALRLYKLAYDTRADPTLLFSIARVLHKQGSLDEAARYYQKFLASGAGDVDHRRRAQEYLSQLRAADSLRPSTSEMTSNAAAPVVQPAKELKPIYKKWWFWTILGTVAAAGIVGGVVGGIKAGQSSLPEPIVRPFDPQP